MVVLDIAGQLATVSIIVILSFLVVQIHSQLNKISEEIEELRDVFCKVATSIEESKEKPQHRTMHS